MDQKKKKIVVTDGVPEKSAPEHTKKVVGRSIVVVEAETVAEQADRSKAATGRMDSETPSQTPAPKKRSVSTPKHRATHAKKPTASVGVRQNADNRSLHVNDVKPHKPSKPRPHTADTTSSIPTKHPETGTAPSGVKKMTQSPRSRPYRGRKVRYWATLSIALSLVLGIGAGFVASQLSVRRPALPTSHTSTQSSDSLAPQTITTLQQRNLRRVNSVNTLAQAIRAYRVSFGTVPTFEQLNDPAWRAWNLYLFDGNVLCVGEASAPCTLVHTPSYDAIAYKTFGSDNATCDADCPVFSLSVLQEPDQKPYTAE